MRHPLQKGVVAFAAGILLAGVTPLFVASAASAQGLIFDWGGEKTADSGKQHIKFSGPGKAGDIIVSFGDRKLYFFTAPGEADTYPVAIPRDQSRWEGVTTVSMKRENPSWTPTAHMLSENPKLPRWVPGGHPMNPLGNRAMYLGSSDYRIHGTDAPWTIGTAASKGCVRMFNKDVADLYPRVKVGSKVTVTWQKFDGKTLAVASSAKPVSDPDQSPQNKALLASLTQKGDATAQSGKPSNVKSRKPVDASDDDSQASSSEKAEKSPEKSKVAAIAEEPVVKRKRSKSADSAEFSGDTADQSRQPAVGPAEQQVLKQKMAKAAESTETPDEGGERAKTKVAPAAPEAVRAARRVRSATRQVSSPKSEARTDATPAPASTSSEQASLAVAERALAAAERAAEAAERAAAAAERAVAASEKRGQTISAEPGQSSVVAH